MFNKLVEKIKEYESAVLGFSGGVDSSLVAYALKASEIPFICATVQTPLQTKRELAQSAFFCEEYGINHRLIELNVLDNGSIQSNTKDRCYFCKKAIFGALFSFANENGYKVVLDGTNIDDSGEYRPGLRAKDELGVKSPLAELGFTKEDIRLMSKELGLPTWNMPSSSCLATRIPYGTALDKSVLNSVEMAEALLREHGAGYIRVRAHGDIARIEAKDISKMYSILNEEVVKQIKSYGFKFVCLDMDGYKRGCYD